ncbi:macrolide ABC transporter ATP-binding protein [Dolosigranulum pigrum]|jgi:ABC transporter, ATP-binding protein|uniref:Macrolide ABC transporter ATP-binding protein n=1 Tax=Dolosigranulum pigrum TaxID=29394 RepID=A0A1S8KL96_9LACT|nr:ABC transporter ATP-binding protein [Dolosigranulum pigrum]OOL80518.1 macrolide ABC transporter ATP-binding protein [Dolosigranulum pigrum]QJS96896.1 ABC transporter ATP-binding protein [Dolosigranulum pigrum]QJS97834.1 ABC transporter ATP-binding protein [Dolosigranulum pigrum]QTJ32465.1 ABC transporter ATP-binding protein [Dolosigranulum pigrum]QTJ34213.1 ABC transporter ATP-binding protein [Dolosigranulum pigrum]
MSYIDVINESKFFTSGESKVTANDQMTFNIEKGEFAVIVGPSGAGKTTVLNILGGMDSADEGEVIIDGKNIAEFDTKQLTQYRRDDVGFIFQSYNLIPNLTAKENVDFAAEISPDALDSEKVLEDVGLGHRKENFPAQLSGGEQQRVAIARALAKKPKLLLCDEPTGALDFETGKKVLELLQFSKEQYGATVVVITHNQAIAPIADRVIEIADAKVRNMTINESPASVDSIEW